MYVPQLYETSGKFEDVTLPGDVTLHVRTDSAVANAQRSKTGCHHFSQVRLTKSANSDNIAATTIQSRQQALGLIRTADLQQFFQDCLDRLGIPLGVLLLMSIGHVVIQQLTLNETAQQALFVMYGAVWCRQVLGQSGISTSEQPLTGMSRRVRLSVPFMHALQPAQHRLDT